MRVVQLVQRREKCGTIFHGGCEFVEVVAFSRCQRDWWPPASLPHPVNAALYDTYMPKKCKIWVGLFNERRSKQGSQSHSIHLTWGMRVGRMGCTACHGHHSCIYRSGWMIEWYRYLRQKQKGIDDYGKWLGKHPALGFERCCKNSQNYQNVHRYKCTKYVTDDCHRKLPRQIYLKFYSFDIHSFRHNVNKKG